MQTHKKTDQSQRKADRGEDRATAQAMQPVDKVLDLVANTGRIDDPWFWRDRWAD